MCLVLQKKKKKINEKIRKQKQTIQNTKYKKNVKWGYFYDFHGDVYPFYRNIGCISNVYCV